MNPQSPRAFALVGVHSYAFDPGSTRFGVSLGAGVDIDIAPRLSLEGRYELHNVNNNAPITSFSNFNLGLRLFL
jgi:opacity protein-like surface antigen